MNKALKVADVMTRYVEFLEPTATAQDAAVMMGDLDVGALPVGSADQLEGVVTDRDILYRVVAAGLDGTVVRVTDIVSRPVVTCVEDDTIRIAMDIMSSHHVRRLPVTGKVGGVVGWVTMADLSRKLLIDSGVLQEGLRQLEVV